MDDFVIRPRATSLVAALVLLNLMLVFAHS